MPQTQVRVVGSYPGLLRFHTKENPSRSARVSKTPVSEPSLTLVSPTSSSTH